MTYLGNRLVNSTVYIPFTTHDKDGGAVAPLSAFENTDVRIYKNGSDVQRSSASGVTMTSPFDTVTGLHLLAIDLSDNADAGFYAADAHYTVVLTPDETVDTETVVRVLAQFDIVASSSDPWATALPGAYGAGTAGEILGNVGAEVLTELASTSYAEPSNAPTWPINVVDMLRWMTALSLNKLIQTTSQIRLRNQADSSDIASAGNVDNGSSFSRNLWS